MEHLTTIIIMGIIFWGTLLCVMFLTAFTNSLPKNKIVKQGESNHLQEHVKRVNADYERRKKEIEAKRTVSKTTLDTLEQTAKVNSRVAQTPEEKAAANAEIEALKIWRLSQQAKR